MSLVERDTQNLRQLRIDGEAEIAKLEERIAQVKQKLTAIGEIERGLNANVPTHFIAVIDLRNDVPVFSEINGTVAELRKSESVRAIKVVVSPATFVKYNNEFGALGFARDTSLEFLYNGSFVLDHYPGTIDMGTF
jgi:hypothetical protein